MGFRVEGWGFLICVGFRVEGLGNVAKISRGYRSYVWNLEPRGVEWPRTWRLLVLGCM